MITRRAANLSPARQEDGQPPIPPDLATVFRNSRRSPAEAVPYESFSQRCETLCTGARHSSQQRAERSRDSRIPRVGAPHRRDSARYLRPVGVDEGAGQHNQDQNTRDLDVRDLARPGGYRLVRFLSRSGHTCSVALGGPDRKSQALYLRSYNSNAVYRGGRGYRSGVSPVFSPIVKNFLCLSARSTSAWYGSVWGRIVGQDLAPDCSAPDIR